MPDPSPRPTLDALRGLARDVATRAHAPYSGRSEGVALLLADGGWTPGVRVENASFPLLIPPLVAALSAARVAGRSDLVAAASSAAFSASDAAFLEEATRASWRQDAPGLLVRADAADVPEPTHALRPFLTNAAPSSDAEGVALALRVAERAWAPVSHFPVGCVALTADGRLVAGTNVEHPDWTRGLCAERVALASALAHEAGPIERVWIACPLDPSGTPCGACRQVLAELVPGVPIVLARGDAPPLVTTPEALLPGAFRGDGLRARG